MSIVDEARLHKLWRFPDIARKARWAQVEVSHNQTGTGVDNCHIPVSFLSREGIDTLCGVYRRALPPHSGAR
jgi:hypothetical protein